MNASRVEDPAVRSRTGNSPQLVLFDGFELYLGGQPRKPCANEQRLVAALALKGRLARGAAASLLWPDASEIRAQGNLRTALWRLARICPRLIVIDGERLALDRAVVVDVHAFMTWARELVNGDVRDEDLNNARAHRGELLPGWYADWVVAEREHLRQLRLRALDALARELARRGRLAAAIEIALLAIHIDPLRESAHRTLITLHLAEDNVSEAARQVRVFSRLLREELGVMPSRQVLELVAARMPSI
jgi:DNA-binding SARP family transcriptional activator